MQLIRDARRILLDAGPFFRFADAGKLHEFAAYLDHRAYWVVDVEAEIERRSRSSDPRWRTHESLHQLDDLSFPRHQAIRLPVPLIEEVERIRSQWAKPREHPRKHRGEISTVLLAVHDKFEMTIIDDKRGQKLAHLRDIATRSTTALVAEMVAAGFLDHDDGQKIFQATKHDASLADYLYEVKNCEIVIKRSQPTRIRETSTQ